MNTSFVLVYFIETVILLLRHENVQERYNYCAGQPMSVFEAISVLPKLLKMDMVQMSKTGNRLEI